jgi:hypothetical protein
MKKVILVVLLATLPMVSHGAGYVIADYGVGGKVHDPSYGIELGGIFLSPLHPTGGAFSAGVGVSVATTDDNPTSAEAPLGTNFTSTKNLNDGNETEVHAVFGVEMVPSLFAVAGIGYATQDITTTGVASGQRFKTGSTTDHNVTGLFGVRFVQEWVNIGLGFHTRRGIMASLGIAF